MTALPVTPPQRKSAPAPLPDEAALRSLIEHVHPFDWSWLVIWRRPSEEKIGTFTSFQAIERNKILSYIRRYRDTDHLYVSLGSQTTQPPKGKRGMASDVKTISVLWADLDTADGVHSAANLPPTWEDALKLLIDIPVMPSMIIHTGGGIQVYWFLDRPYHTDDSRVVATVEAVQWHIQQRGKQRGWHVDMLSDASRVFRLPGTLNHKHSPPKPVRVLQHSDAAYSLATFEGLLTTYDQDTTVKAQRQARARLESGEQRHGSIDAFNAAHDHVELLERYGYTWDGQRMRHPDASTAYAAGVVLDRTHNMSFHWDSADPIHHGRTACAAATPFTLFCTYEHGGNFAAAMDAIRALGWSDQAPYELPPTQTIHKQWISDALTTLPPARGVLIKSPIGTGKTELLLRVIPDYASVLVIGHRRNLLREQARRLGLAYYEDHPDLAGCKRLAICLDSIEKLSTRQKFDYVIIDESEQVLSHATGRTIKPRRQGCLEYLRHFQETATQVVYLDADMGRISHQYAGRVLGAEALHVVINTYRPGNKTFINYPTEDHLKTSLFAALKQGKRCAVAANSREQVKTLQKLIESGYPHLRVMAVHGENSADPAVQGFIRNINDQVTDYDVLLYSPSLGTGVSIDRRWFDHVYVFGHGQPTTHRDILQQAGRVRSPKSGEIHCWISAQRQDLPTEIETLKTRCIKNATDTGLLIGISTDGEVYSKDDDYLCLWADVASERHTSLNNLRDLFYTAVRMDGHTIIPADAPDRQALAAARDAYKSAKAAVLEEKAEALRTIESIDTHAAEALRHKGELTATEHLQLYQYDLCEFYEIEPSAIDAQLVTEDQRGLRRNAQRLALLIDQQAARWKDEAEQPNALPDRNHHQLAARLRRDLLARAGVTPLQIDILKTNPKVVTPADDFAQYALTRRMEIWALLGLVVPRNIAEAPIQFVQALLAQLGLALQGTQKRIKGTTKRIREYVLTHDAWVGALHYAERWLALHPIGTAHEQEVNYGN